MHSTGSLVMEFSFASSASKMRSFKQAQPQNSFHTILREHCEVFLKEETGMEIN